MQLSAGGGDARWPDDMVIAIEDHATPLLELLWVREAYGLRPDGDAPPRLVVTPSTLSAAPGAAVWEAAWPEFWDEVVRHAGHGLEPGLLDAIGRAAPGSQERDELFHRALGPRWGMRFGDSAVGPGFQRWHEQHVFRLAQQMRRPLQEHPERRAVAALVPAWQAGLTRIVTIPCHGEHTRRIGASALLMTDATRADPARFAAALDTFR